MRCGLSRNEPARFCFTPTCFTVKQISDRLARHQRQLEGFPARVAKAAHQGEVDVAQLPTWFQVDVTHEEQIASGSRRELIALHREVYQRKAEVLLSVRERPAHHREE
jgi:hypothetical protein